MIGICKHCQEERSLRYPGACDQCHIDILCKKKLEQFQKDFKPASAYNQYIWELYLSYITRYLLRHYHMAQTQGLKKVLETNHISPAISSWGQINKCAQYFENQILKHHHSPSPFIKIGKVLQDLKIIPIRELSREVHLNNQLEYFAERSITIAKDYANNLIKNRRAVSTVVTNIMTLKQYHQWITSTYPHVEWIQSPVEICMAYLATIQNEHTRHMTMLSLRKFFRWAVFCKRILYNPFEGIPCAKSKPLMVSICSDEQTKKIMAFIKNPKSPPESAMLLALVLFFGLTSRDLAYSTIEVQAGRLWIHLFKTPNTLSPRGRRNNYILRLPTRPNWLLELQKRFLSDWEKRYAQVNKRFNNPLLVLSRTYHNNRPISSPFLRRRFYRATRLACGENVPIRIVRQTCGHLHVKGDDGSILGHMGWSKQKAFDYVWIPKIVYTRTRKLKSP